MKTIGYLFLIFGVIDFLLCYCDVLLTGEMFVFGETYWSPYLAGVIGSILIWLSNKKKGEEYVLDAELEKEILSEEGFTFKTTPENSSLTQTFLVTKGQKLDEFSCKKGNVRIVNQKGKIFEAYYKDLSAKSFENNGLQYSVKSNDGQKITFFRDEKILSKECWDVIEAIIHPEVSFLSNFS
ncbi:MAG: hypothetical protein LBJ47_01780 [Tannerella sp.]|jgi:hypothetical protein|nr:hypothetical protein [Tannerella sp.]